MKKLLAYTLLVSSLVSINGAQAFGLDKLKEINPVQVVQLLEKAKATSAETDIVLKAVEKVKGSKELFCKGYKLIKVRSSIIDSLAVLCK